MASTRIPEHPESKEFARLGELLAGYTEAGYDTEVLIGALQLSSNSVEAGGLFFALPGITADGRNYIDQAIANGAAAVAFESRGATITGTEKYGVPVVGVEDLKSRLGSIAARFYGNPTSDMAVVGITGTNGKTTTAWLVAQALESLGAQCAYCGTIGTGRVDDLTDSELTTADAIAIQRQMAVFRNEGIDSACMEVSSHGLDQGRVDGVEFDVAVFTNLSQDHLDYHENMERYAAAKRRLFEFDSLAATVINTDDEFGKFLFNFCESRPQPCNTISYGLAGAALIPANLSIDDKGIRFDLEYHGQTVPVSSRLIGDINVHNILATLGTLIGLGHSIDDAARVVSGLVPPPGRMEVFRNRPDQPTVVVDYAHTPDALERALLSLKPLCNGELVAVFGCGGDRDQGKRPMMGRVAQTIANRVVVTDDNPRSEPPEQIVGHILEGMEPPVTVIHDRCAAIAEAIGSAGQNDLVLVAGKGHERTQTTGDQVIPLSDRDLVAESLEALA